MDLAGSLIVLLTDASRWPEVARLHRDAGLYPQALPVHAADPAAHHQAWLQIMVRDAPTVVLSDRSALGPGATARLEAAAETVAGLPWHVLHLDAGRQGDAYVLTPEGAALLVDAIPAPGEGTPAPPLAAVLEGVPDLAVLALEPPVAVTVDSVELTVVEHPEQLDALPDDRLVLLVPPGAAVMASPLELATTLVASGQEVLVGAGGEAALGPAAAVRAVLPPPGAGEGGGGVFTVVDDRSASGLAAAGGRILDGATGAPVMVLLGEPAAVAQVATVARAGTGDDIASLLRYEGALPGSSELTEAGDELVSLPFWTPEFCATVVRAAEALGAWAADPLDPVPGHEVSLAVLCPRLFAHVEDHLAAVVVPQLRFQWPTLEYHGLRDAFVIKYSPADREGLRLHHDVAQLSASVRLNCGYEGGELVFPRQGVTNAGLAVGHLLAWPSLVTHPHAGEPVTAGVKYGLTIWFELPGPRDS